MPARRKYGSKRRTPYRKRKQTKKSRYARKKRTVKKAGTIVKKTRLSYSTATPGTLDIPNRMFMRSTYNVSYTQQLIMLPAVSGTMGMMAQSFWANDANQVLWPDTLVDWNHGAVSLTSGTLPGDLDGANQMCTVPNSFWLHQEVTEATMTVIATPIDANLGDGAGGADPTVYSEHALVWLCCSKFWNPMQAGATPPDTLSNDSIRDSRNTVTATTTYVPGANPVSAVLKYKFTPRMLFQVKDLSDREGAFRSTPNPDYSIRGIHPQVEAIFNVGTVSAGNQATGTLAAPAFVRGIPRPHRYQVKIDYKFRCFNPRLVQDNIPVD